MFIHSDPVWSAAALAVQAADANGTTSAPCIETFVESFLTSFIDVLTDEARQIFWHVVDGMDPTDPHRMVYAAEVLRALRYVSRRGLSACAIIGEFGSLEAITLERLLLWLIEEHGYVLAE
jgi:hypothetical protein